MTSFSFRWMLLGLVAVCAGGCALSFLDFPLAGTGTGGSGGGTSSSATTTASSAGTGGAGTGGVGTGGGASSASSTSSSTSSTSTTTSSSTSSTSTSSTSSSASSSSGTTCQPGTADCNGNTLDACECATAGCCGTGCQTTHDSGVSGVHYDDCNPLMTYSALTALAACTAYAISVGGSAANCSDGWECSGVPPLFVCHTDAAQTTCVSYCWAYSGTMAGVVSPCGCPIVTTGGWD